MKKLEERKKPPTSLAPPASLAPTSASLIGEPATNTNEPGTTPDAPGTLAPEQRRAWHQSNGKPGTTGEPGTNIGVGAPLAPHIMARSIGPSPAISLRRECTL